MLQGVFDGVSGCVLGGGGGRRHTSIVITPASLRVSPYPRRMQFLLKTHRNYRSCTAASSGWDREKETKDIKRKKKGGYNKIRAGGVGWVVRNKLVQLYRIKAI